MNDTQIQLTITLDQLKLLIECLDRKKARTAKLENLQDYLEYRLKLVEPQVEREIDLDEIPF